jgi:hypothetical protein
LSSSTTPPARPPGSDALVALAWWLGLAVLGCAAATLLFRRAAR